MTSLWSIGENPFWLDESAEEGSGKFESASVDDVGGPVLEVGTGGLVACGCREVERRDSNFITADEEQSGEGGATAGGDFGDELGGYRVADARERAKGVVDNLAGGLDFPSGDGGAGDFGDLAGGFVGGVFGVVLLHFLLCLLVGDEPWGLAVGEPLLFFGSLLGCGQEVLELVHDECGSDSGDDTDDETSYYGRAFAHLLLLIL